MSTYLDLCNAVESTGIAVSAITLPSSAGTYAVVQMTSQVPEADGDDKPLIFGDYMQVDLFTDSDVDAKANAIRAAAEAAGFTYRGRSDSAQGARQHAEIRLRKLVMAT